jgi:hypothetical protein
MLFGRVWQKIGGLVNSLGSDHYHYHLHILQLLSPQYPAMGAWYDALIKGHFARYI